MAKMMGLSAIVLTISGVTVSLMERPTKTSAPTKASASVRASVSLASSAFHGFIPKSRPLKTTPLESHRIRFSGLTPSEM